MTRKRIFIITALALSAGVAAVAVVAFIRPSLISLLLRQYPEEKSADQHLSRTPEMTENESPKPKLQAPAQEAKEEAVLTAATDYALPSTRQSEIVKAARDIVLAQAGMAKGDKEAPSKLRSSMQVMSLLLRRLKPGDVMPSEVQSAALYVLSGGEPSILESLSISPVVTAAQRKFLLGISHYAGADFENARKELGPANAMELDAVLAAQLSIARAQLLPEGDFNESLRLLAFAADSMPGTLIEEAAIRRIVVRSGGAENSTVLFYWAQRYFRRFQNSFYYSDFEASLVSAISNVMARHVKLEPDALTDLFRMAGESRTAKLSQQLLLLAVRTGNTAFCQEVTNAVTQTYGLDPTVFKNISVLMKICTAADGDPHDLAALKMIHAVDIDAGVADLLAQAISISETIQDNAPLTDDGQFGPDLPLAAEHDYADLVASVTQQLSGSIKSSNRIQNNESTSER
jgi:hypothetical protein